MSAPQHDPLGWRRPYSPGPLTPSQYQQYWEDGFVVLAGLLSQEDLQPSCAAIERSEKLAVSECSPVSTGTLPVAAFRRVDEVARRLLAAGLISDAAESADVFRRLILLEKQFGEASVLVHKDGRLPPEFAALWSSPKLLAVAQQLLGPDVAGHPSWNLRAKTPRQAAATVPWHQDTAYCGRDSWTTLQVTAWVPLLDVSPANGCMQLLRGGHRSGKTAPHQAAVGDTWYVALDEAAAVAELGVDFERDLVTAAMARGDVLLFNNLIPHRSLDNTSSDIRWSLDLRWQHPDAPAGDWGLKGPLRLTAAGNPAFRPAWDGWADRDKKSGEARPPDVAAAEAAAAAAAEGAAAEPAADAASGGDPALSTILVGPWLDTWPVVHENKHTRAWAALTAAQRAAAAAAAAAP